MKLQIWSSILGAILISFITERRGWKWWESAILVGGIDLLALGMAIAYARK